MGIFTMLTIREVDARKTRLRQRAASNPGFSSYLSAPSFVKNEKPNVGHVVAVEKPASILLQNEYQTFYDNITKAGWRKTRTRWQKREEPREFLTTQRLEKYRVLRDKLRLEIFGCANTFECNS